MENTISYQIVGDPQIFTRDDGVSLVVIVIHPSPISHPTLVDPIHSRSIFLEFNSPESARDTFGMMAAVIGQKIAEATN